MTQAGYAGNPRDNVVPAAVACVLAGIGVYAGAARFARRRPGRRATTGGLLAAALAVATSRSLRPTCPTRSTSSPPAPTAGRIWTRWST
jgi:hypothetical protein